MLVGVYFALGRRKIPLFEHLLALPAEVLSRPALLLGDFNTGRHELDEAGATFIVPEYLAKLETRGWIDLWRHVHPQGREFSWFSPRGNGFRIDHALGTPAFQGLVRSVEYSHRERECGISDHSVLVLDAGAPAPSA